jgi:hypothetical protein
MTQNTEAVKTIKPLTADQELRLKISEQRKLTKDLLEQSKVMKSDRKDAERKEAEALMADLSALASFPIVVGDHTLTQEEAFVTGKKSTINVGDEKKERAHTIFAPSATVNSIQKAVTRLKKLMNGEAIRPKSNEDVQA